MPHGARSLSRRSSTALIALALTVAACASGTHRAGGELTSTTAAPATRSTTTGPAAAPSTVLPTVSAPSTTALADHGSDTAVSAPDAPAFDVRVDAVTAADLPSTWREGCPTTPDELRRLTLSHWGFDDTAHTGVLIVNASVVDAVTMVFQSLYDQRFPIRLMQPVDAYGGSDDASIAADNTAGFNCRTAVANGPPQWSQHAYGLAIDVNPLENPSTLNGQVYPPAGAAYLDRSDVRPGMAVDGGPLVSAFARIGWGWGGRWANVDYQHFSQNGR